MGVTIRGEFEGSPSYDMSYTTFNRLREHIANTVSEEFGWHYELMPFACTAMVNANAYDAMTEELIRKYKLKKRFLSFLYQQDVKGRLSPYKCKALYDQIATMTSTRLYGYTAYPAECMTIDKFRALLSECFERRAYLIWS